MIRDILTNSEAYEKPTFRMTTAAVNGPRLAALGVPSILSAGNPSPYRRY